MNKVYACIDLKSFYASCECVEKNLNPITTNLVVADKTRTEKTICLALTPALKKYGLSGRARLYEVVSKVKEINRKRKEKVGKLTKKSFDEEELENNENLEVDFIIAPPRMRLYMKYSANIYNIYLKYFSKEDIYVYSIDEVFLDLTNYHYIYGYDYQKLITNVIKDIYDTTGITATSGIGTNLYLAKIAMDIEAKKKDANSDGVRIAYLDEFTYRKKLWHHKPLTDFWRIGKGISKKLELNGMYCMEDIAKCSLENENKLFKLFGINAELLIDHAWGYEPCTMKDIKNYKPKNNSLSSSQVLQTPYNYQNAKLIVKEMTELLVLNLTSKNYLTDLISLTINYDVSNLNNDYKGEIKKDFYGRKVPIPAASSIRLSYKTASLGIISNAIIKLYEEITDKNLLIRKINITFCNLDKNTNKTRIIKQFDIFHNSLTENKRIIEEIREEQEENKLKNTILNLKYRYGKNTILKGMNLEEKATTIIRNNQVGGHQG